MRKEVNQVEGGNNVQTTEVYVGGIYKHFKGKLVVVTGLAKHSETEEKLVIYKHVGSDELWVRPYELFISKVDRNKYPLCDQEYRFELVDKNEKFERTVVIEI